MSYIKPRNFLRLEVENAPTGLVNLVQNPSGDLGGWGWLTPVVDTVMRGIDDPTYNLIPNPSADVDVSGWAASATLTRDGTYGYGPAGCFKLVTASGAGAATGYAYPYPGGVFIPASSGKYSFDVQVFGTGSCYVQLYSNPTGAQFAITNTVALTGSFQKLTVTGTAPAGTTSIYPVIRQATAGAQTLYFDIANLVPVGVKKHLLEFTTTAAANYFGTESLPMAAGDYVAAFYAYESSGTDAPYWRTRFEFLDSNQGYISSSAQSGYLSGTNFYQQPAVQAPSGTAYVRLRYDVYSTTGGANPAASRKMRLSQVAVSTASTSAALSGMSYVGPQTYSDVLDEALSVKVTRLPLDVGTLNASILDTDLDPTQTTAVRPGRRARLLALSGVDSTWQPLYNGKLDAAQVTYNLDRPADEQTTVNLSALDVNSLLANQGAAQGVATVAELPFVLEGAGVPWDIDGSGNQVPNAVVVAQNDNASVLDQVAITRDTALAYAWTDVRGVLTVRSDRTSKYYHPEPGSSGEPFRFDEDDYSDIVVGFDTASIINTVFVSVVSNAGGDTIERLYGPYVDTASVKQWGPKSATFTIQGINGATDVANYAQAVLDANSEPVVRPTSVTIPIRTVQDLIPGKALIDMYATAYIVNAAKGIATNVRVTSIDHDIQPDKWVMTLGLGDVSTVASPTVAPPTYSQLATDGTWISPTLAGSWVNYGSGYAVSGYFRQKGQVLLRGLVKSGTGIIFTLPAGYRPSGQQIFPVMCTGNALARVDITSGGAVTLYAGSASGYVSLDGITFAAEL